MQLYYTDNHFIGGPSKVVNNLKLGLSLLNENVEENPNDLNPLKKVLFTQPHHKITEHDLSKIIIGPNICVLPIDLSFVLHQKYHKILTPSLWVYNKYKRWISEEKLEVWPVGIDTELFKNTSKDEKKYDCLIYKKNRSDEELAFVMELLTEFNQTFNVIQYGSYNEQMFLDSISKSKYCFMLDNTESQGIATQEILSSNLPMFVWDMDFWDHRGEEYKVPATSVPYWNDCCGEKTSEKDHIKDLFSQFLSRQKHYSPRYYIVENLNLKKSALKLLNLYDSII